MDDLLAAGTLRTSISLEETDEATCWSLQYHSDVMSYLVQCIGFIATVARAHVFSFAVDSLLPPTGRTVNFKEETEMERNARRKRPEDRDRRQHNPPAFFI